MLKVKWTTVDVQEVSLWISGSCQSLKKHAQDEMNTHVRTINRHNVKLTHMPKLLIENKREVKIGTASRRS